MAVRAILITGDPILHSPAKPVTIFDDDLRVLVDDMFETMQTAPGVGLAGPQVGIARRLFVYHWEDEDQMIWRGVAINPTLWVSPTPTGAADPEEDAEGCLSVPGERFPLTRASSAILSAVDLDGHAFEIRADGWLARIFQHEYDHLDGTLYLDRLAHEYEKPAAKAIRKAGWDGPGHSWLPGEEALEG